MAADRGGTHPRPAGTPRLDRRAPSHAPEAEQHTDWGPIYIHGGGFTYGTLDEFEVPMR